MPYVMPLFRILSMAKRMDIWEKHISWSSRFPDNPPYCESAVPSENSL